MAGGTTGSTGTTSPKFLFNLELYPIAYRNGRRLSRIGSRAGIVFNGNTNNCFIVGRGFRPEAYSLRIGATGHLLISTRLLFGGVSGGFDNTAFAFATPAAMSSREWHEGLLVHI